MCSENRKTENLFHLTADTVFEAKDIDDALEQLSKHFADVMESTFEHKGELHIRKMGNVRSTYEPKNDRS